MTAEIDAFHAAIFAAPADPLPRLVYADWLDDRGEADYAELVRLATTGRRCSLEARRRRAVLTRTLLRDWQLTGLFDDQGRPLLAGGVFPDTVICSTPILRSAHWPPYLRPRRMWLTVVPEDEPGLAYLPQLASLVELHTCSSEWRTAPPAPALAALAASSHIGRLRTLTLEDFVPTPAELDAFAGCALAVRLERLEIKHLDLAGPDGRLLQVLEAVGPAAGGRVEFHTTHEVAHARAYR